MSEFNEPIGSEAPRGVSRRTVTKAMAWAVPAIAIAAPVPAFAGASRGTITFTDQNCKLPGNSAVDPYTNGAVYIFTATNTTALPIEIVINFVARTGQSFNATDVTVVRLSGTGPKCTSLGSTFSVAPGENTFALVTKEWSNSANGMLTVSFTVDGVQAPLGSTPSNDLNPITSNPACQIGGSCNLISDEYKKCILRGLGQQICAVIP